MKYLVMALVVGSVTLAQAVEEKSRTDCLVSVKLNQVFTGVTSDKSYDFPQSDDGVGKVTLKPAKPGDRYDKDYGTFLTMDTRFSEKIRNKDITFNMAGTTNEGAVVPSKRFFKIEVASTGDTVSIKIQDQAESKSGTGAVKAKEEPGAIATIACGSDFTLPAPLTNKIGKSVTEVKYNNQYHTSFAYLNECLKLAGMTPVDCPVIEHEEVSLPKKASRKLKPNLAPGMAGDDVSASVEKKSGQGQ